MREKILIEISTNKQNKKKIDIYIVNKSMDLFGKVYISKKLFDSVYPGDKKMVIRQAHNCYSITKIS